MTLSDISRDLYRVRHQNQVIDFAGQMVVAPVSVQLSLESSDEDWCKQLPWIKVNMVTWILSILLPTQLNFHSNDRIFILYSGMGATNTILHFSDNDVNTQA